MDGWVEDIAHFRHGCRLPSRGQRDILLGHGEGEGRIGEIKSGRVQTRGSPPGKDMIFFGPGGDGDGIAHAIGALAGGIRAAVRDGDGMEGVDFVRKSAPL